MVKFHFAHSKRPTLAQKRWNEFRFDGNTFTTRMDPDAQALKYPTPNPVYGPRNKIYDVEYLGGVNDADNTVAIATLDRSCSQYKLFDAGTLPLMFSYLGLGMASDSRNDAYNAQYVSTMLESISAAYATQLTDLAFMTADYKTTIPQMTDGSAAMIGFMTWYQCVVQNIASVMAKYNSTLALVDYLVKMGYNGEAPYTTELTNLFKKQNLYTLLDQIGVIISQEFFDLDWYQEVSVLNGLPSRSAGDVQSPLLTITGSTFIPDVEVSLNNEIVFSTITADKPGYDAFNKIVVGKTTYTFQSLVQHIMESFDPVDILAFCRQVYSGQVTSTATAYVNDIIDCLHALVNSCAVFKNYTVDLRTFLMLVQSSTNLNHWVYGTPYTRPSKPREQATPECIRVVEDIFKAFGTNGNMVYDQTTRKWKVYTLWRGGSGIAEYDAYNGGFAISTSVRTIPTADSYTGAQYLFPRMFYRYKDGSGMRYQRFVNRSGVYFMMGVTSFNAAQLAQNPYFAYLNVLNNDDVTIEVPTVTLPTVTSDYVLMSTVNKLIISIFGFGMGVYGSESNPIRNYVVDTNNIMLVGRQFGDYAEASLEYITARAPMRQIDKDVNIGFKSASVTQDRATDNMDSPIR